MNTKSVLCIASSNTQAEDILNELKGANFPDHDIAVMFFNKKRTTEFAFEHKTERANGGMSIGAGIGGVIGGVFGWIAGTGALALPGAGPMIAASPVLAIFGGVVIGALLGGLIGLSTAEIEAEREERKIASGSILIAAHAKDPEQMHCAKDIFVNEGASDIFVKEEAAEASQPGEPDPTNHETMASSR